MGNWDAVDNWILSLYKDVNTASDIYEGYTNAVAIGTVTIDCGAPNEWGGGGC